MPTSSQFSKVITSLFVKWVKNKISETDNSMVIPRRKEGWGEVEEENRGINGDGKRHDLGWSLTIYR